MSFQPFTDVADVGGELVARILGQPPNRHVEHHERIPALNAKQLAEPFGCWGSARPRIPALADPDGGRWGVAARASRRVARGVVEVLVGRDEPIPDGPTWVSVEDQHGGQECGVPSTRQHAVVSRSLTSLGRVARAVTPVKR
jgi:hypothetical protein